MKGRLRRALTELCRSERGVALPMALMITVVAMGFAAVPVVASINAQSGGSHNQGSNEALAAAEAGAEVALLKQSQMLSNVADDSHPPCVAEKLPIGSGGESGWCPKVPDPSEELPKVGAAEYSYQVRPCYADEGGCGDLASTDTETCSATQNKLLVEIVSTGYATVAGRQITKRIAVTGCANTKAPRSVPGEIATIEEEEKTIREEIVATQAEVVTVEKTITEKEKKAVVVAGEEKTEIATTEKKYEGEIHKLEETKSELIKQREQLKKELIEKQKTVERVRTEPAGTEYTETPGEKYTETTKTPPPNVWGGGQIVGIEGLPMGNNGQIYNGGAASNKEVKLEGSANVCGTIHYGTIFHTDNSTSSKAPSGCAAGRTVTQTTATYPAVPLPSNIATENSDYRLCSETACHAGLDPVPSNVWQRGNMEYNQANKALKVNYSELTLEGTAPYYLCQLILAGGSSLKSGAGKSITIYFAPPSSCTGLNGGPQLQIANGTYVYGDASNGPKFLFAGSSSSPSSSKIEFAGGAKSEQFVVYAPYSQIVANNGIEMTGAIIGNTLELQGGANINKYGPFTPPPAETFLPSTETKVEKQKPPTKTPHKSKYLEELEAEVKTLESKIDTKEAEITQIETEIRRLEGEEKTSVGTIKTVRQGEIKQLAEERTRLESEIVTLDNTIVTYNEQIEVLIGKKKELGEKTGGAAEAIKKQSFRECTGEPPVAGLAPDEGC
jgi:predicted  nucleic acid-binding Zn-ribbon protein